MGKLWRFSLSIIVFSIVSVVSFVFLPWEVEYKQSAFSPSLMAKGSLGYELTFMDNWLNAIDVDTSDVSGRPLLIFFFNFTDVDSINALNEVEELYRTYHDAGLQVVGVHEPIFEFEKDESHAVNGISEYGVSFPVTLDRNWNNWQRYRVKALPGWYLYDQSGELEFQAFGSLNYSQLRTRILHSVRRYENLLPFDMPPAPLDVEPQKHGIKVLYAGYKNNSIMGGVGEQTTLEDGLVSYNDGGVYQKDKLYLNGIWKMNENTFQPGSSEVNNNTYLAIRFQNNRNVHAVLGSANGKNAKMLVTLDDKPLPKYQAGPEITYNNLGQSFLEIYQPKDYEIIKSFERDSGVLKLLPQGQNWNLYSLTLER